MWGLQVFTVTVTLFVYFVTISVIILPWKGFSGSGIFHIVVFTGTIFLMLVSYFDCCFTEPGKVPEGWEPDDSVREKGKDGSHRYCRKCQCYKPPRSHHCSICGRCVLRMDHHCPWINNCVGHFNHKFFFLFLLYLSLAALYSFTLFIGSVASSPVKTGSGSNTGPPSTNTIVLLAGYVVTLLPFGVGVSCLCGWHIWLVLRNTTTIEYYEKSRNNIEGADGYRNMYDISTMSNVRELLGPNPLLWFIPVFNISGRGTHYDTIHEEEEGENLLEPSRKCSDAPDLEMGFSSDEPSVSDCDDELKVIRRGRNGSVKSSLEI